MKRVRDWQFKSAGWRRRLFVLLAANRGVITLSLLGLLCGVIVGLIILGLEHAIILGQVMLTEGSDSNRFANLSPMKRFALCVGSALLIGIVFSLLKPTDREVGITHVIQRLFMADARLPLRNAVVQFFSLITAVIGGLSVGREGPASHLGAATGSQLAHRLYLPSNSGRTLAACGVAAAIGASFNTPLAGVIFAMEVVLMEYSIIGFAPVILATVSATSIARASFGDATVFSVPSLELVGYAEYPWLIVCGAAIGAVAALFNETLCRMTTAFPKQKPWLRFGIAGILCGGCAALLPQVMGIGYDTVNLALSGSLLPGLALGILAAKLLASAACVGLGIPGGLIGPTLVMGAVAGTALGSVGNTLSPLDASHPGFYALLGMGTMMAASLQAPLAALTAMLELTGNINVIVPGMLMVITGYLTSRSIQPAPILIRLLRLRGEFFQVGPMDRALQQICVTAIADQRIAPIRGTEYVPKLRQDCEAQRWLWLADEGVVIGAAELAAALPEDDMLIEVRELPVNFRPIIQLDVRDSVAKALRELKGAEANIGLVLWPGTPGLPQLYGAVTVDQLRNAPTDVSQNPFAN